MKSSGFLLLALFILSAPLSASGRNDEEPRRTLLIYSDLSAGSPRRNLESAVSGFMKIHPDIAVDIRVFDHDSYESETEAFLEAGSPDVFLWSGGYRMLAAAKSGLLTDISDIWEEEGLYERMASSVQGMRAGGRQYGIPYGFYHFGIYYRKDLFQEAGLFPPVTLDDLTALCAKLVKKGITPFAIGTRNSWPAALWFEYLNLRINGYSFHQDLVSGRISWLDPGLDRVFSIWRSLTGQGFFLSGHETLSWIDALDLMMEGEAAMYLTGSFAESALEETGGAENYGFFPFPLINAETGLYEVAPTGSLHIPAAAAHPDEARLFLGYMAGSGAQKRMKGSSLSPRNDLEGLTGSPFATAGYSLLSEADGVVPFLDRAFTPGISPAVMEGMKDFLLQPGREDEIRRRLEAIRTGQDNPE